MVWPVIVASLIVLILRQVVYSVLDGSVFGHCFSFLRYIIEQVRKSHPAARPYSDRCGRRPLDELPGIGAELLPGFCFRVELHGLCVFIAFANARRCIL